MAPRKTPERAAEKLQSLGVTTRELQAIELKAQALRDKRNDEIYEAIKLGATERKTAQIADVDPSYAHRCATGKGDPKAARRT